jgi:GntR family transcriptional regulator / MocR family aminotransferase
MVGLLYFSNINQYRFERRPILITINLDNSSSIPLYEQIYSHIKNEIKIGSLTVQTKLPSTRNLANHLSVSRNTIDMAYGQLVSEGYIEALPKKGYFVSQINQLASLSINATFSSKVTKKKNKKYKYNFSPFAVDLVDFPYHTWQQLSKSCLSDNPDLFLLGHNQGDEPLRNAIQTYLHQSRGVHCSKEQIIVGAGVDYLLQLLSSLFSKNAVIAMENPTYLRAYKIFQGLNHKTLSINLDKHGINVEELSHSNADIAYVTPSHQYPLGIVMPIKRRIELLNWASKKENRYIIEDDHDSEFRYKGKPIPSLQGIDTNGKVIYIGTFSRAIAPAIRVGYMVLPYPLLNIYYNNFNYYSSTVSRIDQTIITTFMEMGYFERHLNRMRKNYKTKHDTVLKALKIFHNTIEISGENAGMYLIIKLKTTLSENEILDKASDVEIKLYGLSEHFIEIPQNYSPTLLLGFANLSETELTQGIEKLHATIINFLHS